MSKIAKPIPFDGAPVFHLPSQLCFADGKPFIYRIPVTGSRPITITVSDLPEGINLSGGILYGKGTGHIPVTLNVSASNRDGKAEASILIRFDPDSRLLTPLMGFTTWNAFGSSVTQNDMVTTARKLIESGIADYGYRYINLDSGWQRDTRDPDGSIAPNPKFPDMKKMCSDIHSLGLNCGIYSTPMLTAWGCPEEYLSIPGCTAGDPDPGCSQTNGGIGMTHLEKINAAKWADWGFDYLKYDWEDTDRVNAERMRRELAASSRDFGFCVTVHARPDEKEYWCKNVNSYRSNIDSKDDFAIVLMIFNSVNQWLDAIRPGHFFDMDMLETGYSKLHGGECKLTEDEQIFAYTMRAICLSPIQISCDLTRLTDFDLSLLCAEEVIAIAQDVSSAPVRETLADGIIKFRRTLSDGSEGIALFNTTEEAIDITADIDGKINYRNLWAKEPLAQEDRILRPHAALLLKTIAF